MKAASELTLSREQLYELVWATPPMTLAKVFGVSESSLSKTCAKFKIPKPSLGEWKRIQSGEKLPRPPLAVWMDGADPLVTIRRTVVEKVPDAIQKLIDEELSPEKKIIVTQNEPHQMIELTRQALNKAELDVYQRVTANEPGCLNVDVSRDSIKRVLDVWSTLLKAFAERGWSVTVKDILNSRGVPQRRATYVLVRDELLEVSIDEPSRRRGSVPWEEWHAPGGGWYRPGGFLRFNVISYPYHRHWTERVMRRMESNLNHITAMLVETAEKVRIQRLKDEARQREYDKKMEPIRREEERVRMEQARRKELENSITVWSRYSAGVAFLDAVERSLSTVQGANHADLKAWLQWARAVVEEGNPVTDILNYKFPENAS